MYLFINGGPEEQMTATKGKTQPQKEKHIDINKNMTVTKTE